MHFLLYFFEDKKLYIMEQKVELCSFGSIVDFLFSANSQFYPYFVNNNCHIIFNNQLMENFIVFSIPLCLEMQRSPHLSRLSFLSAGVKKHLRNIFGSNRWFLKKHWGCMSERRFLKKRVVCRTPPSGCFWYICSKNKQDKYLIGKKKVAKSRLFTD